MRDPYETQKLFNSATLTSDWTVPVSIDIVQACTVAPVFALYRRDGWNYLVENALQAISSTEEAEADMTLAKMVLKMLARICPPGEDLTNQDVVQTLSILGLEPYRAVVVQTLAPAVIDEPTLIKYLKVFTQSPDFGRDRMRDLLYVQAHPLAASIPPMLDKLLIKDSGTLNYDLIWRLEEMGYKHSTIESDGDLPVRCAFETRNGVFYYG